MMGGRSKASVGGGGWVKAVQLGAGEERLGETRKRTVVSQMASSQLAVCADVAWVLP